MKRKYHPQISVAILVGMTLLPTISRAQINSGSTGSDGALDFSAITTSTNIVIDMHDHPTGIYNYTYINIPGVVTVSFIPNANNTPVTWLVQSNVVINGVVALSGQTVNNVTGGAGGPGAWAGGNGGSVPGFGLGPGGGGSIGVYGNGGSFGSQGNIGGTDAPAGLVYGNLFLIPLTGGSGGGGASSSAGGGGGGAILIAASGSISINGQIDAIGGYSYNYGGGGSGGAVRLVTETLSGTGELYAYGGGGAGNGGDGRIRIDALQNGFGGSIVGEFTQGFQPIIIPVAGQGAQLTIASVGGTSVSANPSGQLATPDAIVSGQQANPIPVTVNCLNIPLNTPITVTVTPANGSAVSAVGYNNTGTAASSTATVSLVMPRGGGIIYATAATGN